MIPLTFYYVLCFIFTIYAQPFIQGVSKLTVTKNTINSLDQIRPSLLYKGGSKTASSPIYRGGMLGNFFSISLILLTFAIIYIFDIHQSFYVHRYLRCLLFCFVLFCK
uniref:Uncharacterized protein n=1 Tax=Cacopsylla melanoneura TaxID=428564 RepID=A0A8D8MER1_9HEMI